MTSTTAQAPVGREPALAEVELLIGGMTCASCAARVEKKLNRMDGVTASVNYATEKARITCPEGTEVADLIATVVKTGYTAEEPAPPREEVSAAEGEDPELTALRSRLVVSAALAVPGVRPGGPVEGQPAPDDDRRGEGQREPLPVLELQRRDHRHEDDGH